MEIKTLVLGEIGANCYIVTDDSGMSAVIDPGYPEKQLFDAVEGFDVRYILLTHGHFDHIMGVSELKKLTGAKVLMSAADSGMITDDRLNLSDTMYSGGVDGFTVDEMLYDGSVIDFAGGTQVIATPGHTPGSVCFKMGDIIFTGDTLFCKTVGRTDFPGGNLGALIESVDKLQALPGDYTIYPGHNRATTMEEERKHNRFIRKKNDYLNSLK